MDRKREKAGGRMQCFMKKEENPDRCRKMLKILISTTVLSSPHWPPYNFCFSFVSSISVLILSYSVNLLHLPLLCHIVRDPHPQKLNKKSWT